MTLQPSYDHHSEHPIIRIAPQFQVPASTRLCDMLSAQIVDCKVIEIDEEPDYKLDMPARLTVLAWSERHERTMKFSQSLSGEFFQSSPDCGFDFLIVSSAKTAFDWLEDIGVPEEESA